MILFPIPAALTRFPDGWILDLQRIVQHHLDTCTRPILEEMTFSVQTWLLDHQSKRICRGPKLIFLGESPAEWTEDVIRPWRHLIIPDEPVFIDIALPTPPKSDLEDHLAHLILTQRPMQESSVLISMNFKGEAPPDVLIRVAVVLPRDCTTQDIVNVAPPLTLFSKNKITWENPELTMDDQSFRTRHGQCIHVAIQPETDFQSEATDSGDDHNNLLQYSIKLSALSWEPGFPTMIVPDTCKGTDLQEDIDIPMMSRHPTTRLRRRPRPLHDGTEQWLWDLGTVFSAQAVQEVIDGDSYIYVQTWFVDHIHHTRCSQPRPLRLDQCAVAWLEEFRYLWRDLLDTTVPFSVFVINPRPPQSRYQAYNCHVLIEQNRPLGKSAGVFTAMFTSPHVHDSVQGAYSVSRFVRIDDIIETMSLQPHCEGNRCTAYYHFEPIHLVQATELATGFSIRVQITPALTQLPVPPRSQLSEFDEASMMQRSSPDMPQEVGEVSPRPASEPACPTFQFDPHAAIFNPGVYDLASMNEFTQDLHAVWERTAFAWEREPSTADFISWFVDHRTWYPRCLEGRRLTLSGNFADWETIIKNVWQDVIDHDQTHEMYVIIPPNLERAVAGHIIVIQAPHDSWVSSLVTVFDNFIGRRSQHMTRLVITTNEHIHIEHVVSSCGYDLVHGQLNPAVPSQVWIDGHELLTGHPWPGRSGHGITLQIQRLVVPLPVAPVEPNVDEGLALLQTKVQSRQTLLLDELVPDESNIECNWIPIQLIHLDFWPELPSEVFMAEDTTEHEIEQELQTLGYMRHVYAIGSSGKFVTVPINWKATAHHAIYWHSNADSADDVLLHTESLPMDELTHMRFLHSCGFFRAVTTSVRPLREGLLLIIFHNNQPELEGPQMKCKVPTPWPPPQKRVLSKTMIDLAKVQSSSPDQCLSLGVDWTHIVSYFQSTAGVLCPWFSHLDLPEFVKQGLHGATAHEGLIHDPTAFDRLIIYTDGSSKSYNRRRPPLFVADNDQPDAWAFVVLGENYPTDVAPGNVTFLGWQAQQVMYEEQNNAHVGTDQIGAEFAEREALIFAGLWRLALNSTIPTVFRTDSSTTADQSMGRAGFAVEHPTISLLRGIFQALSAGMQTSEFDVSHVRGHAGDIWNEFADFLAKSEAAVGHKLHRQPINLLALKPILPYLWMFLDCNSGLPSLTCHGFDVGPPSLPTEARTAPGPTDEQRPLSCHDVCLSIASLNVGSLFLSPEGFSGKLTYLRQQMKAHGIHIMGIQEARSPPGLSVADDIIRIAGGSDHHNLGVELWLSMTQPLLQRDGKRSRLSRANVQLLHHDPRRILARVSHDCLNCFLVVLHGPQSGRPKQERQTWWEETQSLVSGTCRNLPLYVMIDANAKTGPVNHPIVFDNDDSTSGNTPFFLDFLSTLDLCLPCTGTAHQGETDTWTSPDGQHSHRIDFVAIPQNQLPWCTWSGCVPSLDQGNVHNDHTAIALQLNWKDILRVKQGSNFQGRHDRTKIAHSRDQIQLRHLECQWQCDIETQVQQLNSTIHAELTKACPLDKSTPKKSFIDDATWAIRARKLRLRRRISQAHKQMRRDLLGMWFKQWKGKLSTQTFNEYRQHQTTIDCILVKLSCDYWSCTRLLKQKLQSLKSSAMKSMIADVGHNASAGTLLNIMKPFLGPTNPKKTKTSMFTDCQKG